MKRRYLIITLTVSLIVTVVLLYIVVTGAKVRPLPLSSDRVNQFIAALKTGNSDGLAQLTDPDRRPDFICINRDAYSEIKLDNITPEDLKTAYVSIDVTIPTGSTPSEDGSGKQVPGSMGMRLVQEWRYIGDDWYYCGDWGPDPDNAVLTYGNVAGGPRPTEMPGQ